MMFAECSLVCGDVFALTISCCIILYGAVLASCLHKRCGTSEKGLGKTKNIYINRAMSYSLLSLPNSKSLQTLGRDDKQI